MNNYDAVVLDESLSGLMTACLLQKSGINTLLFENKKNTALKMFESLYYWDPENGALSIGLARLGITDKSIFKQVKYTDKLMCDDICLCRDSDGEAYIKELTDLFPENENEIKELFDDMKMVSDEWIKLLNAASVFKAGSLKHMMKFINTSFSEYLDKNISNDLLKKILMLDCDKQDAAFIVISGYVFSQVMDGYAVTDINEMYGLLKNCFLMNGGTVVNDVTIADITENEGYTIVDENNNKYNCETLISPYTEKVTKERFWGEKNYLYDKKNINTEYIRIHSDLGYKNPSSDILRYKFYYSDGSDEYILNTYNSGKEIVVKVNGKNESMADDKMIEFICNVIGLDKKTEYEIYGNNRIINEIGVSGSDIQGWEFNNSQMRHNVMNFTSPNKGLYTLGEWGCAYFTAAICAANTIINGRKKSE